MIFIKILSFSFCFLNLLLSFFLTYFTNPGTIPDEPFWKMDIPYKMTPQEKIELFALSIIKREEILHDNILSDSDSQKDRVKSTDIMSDSNDVQEDNLDYHEHIVMDELQEPVSSEVIDGDINE